MPCATSLKAAGQLTPSRSRKPLSAPPLWPEALTLPTGAGGCGAVAQAIVAEQWPPAAQLLPSAPPRCSPSLVVVPPSLALPLNRPSVTPGLAEQAEQIHRTKRTKQCEHGDDEP